MILYIKRVEVDLSVARWLITAASFVMACAVVALHAPGHVSMDTSIQLYEAHTGLSVSWNPQFMSALMQWLGGLSTLVWISVLRTVPLNYAYTVMALAFVIVPTLSFLVLGEPLSLKLGLGSLLIVAGLAAIYG